MEALADVRALAVRQQKEWGEILSGFETRNRYEILLPDGSVLFTAEETGSSWLARNFLKSLRPFHLDIADAGGTVQLEVDRRFHFYFHEVQVTGGGQVLGTIKRRFSILRRLYQVIDGQQREYAELFGPILHPWTFEIRRNAQTQGKITKKWSGLGKEVFTDADNFGVEFPPDATPAEKALLLGAVFLIDFVHFERTGND